LMPLPILLAHRLSARLAQVRKEGIVPGLRPDGKTQVTLAYEGDRPAELDTLVISTQHEDGLDREQDLLPALRTHVIEPVLLPLADRVGLATEDYSLLINRSEERRVGKEGRREWAQEPSQQQE